MKVPVLNDKQKKVVQGLVDDFNAAQSILTEAQGKYSRAYNSLWKYLHQEFPEKRGAPFRINQDLELSLHE